MPRFYFNLVDTGNRYPDADGTVLADLEHSQDGEQREFTIHVRSDAGQILLTASLSLLVQPRLGAHMMVLQAMKQRHCQGHCA